MMIDRLQDILHYETFIFDCDGVLWLGNVPIPGTIEVLDTLRKLGKNIIFVTNNSTKSREMYLKKFKSLGFHAELDEIFGSAYCSAFYLKNILKFPTDKRVYVIGMKGIYDELDAVGIKHCGHDDKDGVDDILEIDKLPMESDIGAVLLGLDMNINYKKYAKAFQFIKDPRVHFLASNSDMTFPIGNTVFPGTGALLSALAGPAASIGRVPTVLGKPHNSMLQSILEKGHFDRTKTIMVGDRLDTDIAFGKHGGISTLLVLTGVTRKEQLESSDIQPDYIAASLGNLQIS